MNGKKSILWFLYRRTRVGFAFAGFIGMYAIYNGLLSEKLFLVAVSVFFAELFGACYNDSQDFKEDVRNGRKDKMTVSGIATVSRMRIASIAMLVGSIIAAIASDFLPFSIVYLLLGWAYSNPTIRLKDYSIKSYLLMAFVWFLIPLYLGKTFRGSISGTDALLGLFFSAQYAYLLSQKDATDTKDTTNLFIERGWTKAALICSILALLSSLALLSISTPYVGLIFIWATNSFLKAYQLRRIYSRNINYQTRSNCTLIEFLTPYAFSAAGVLL